MSTPDAFIARYRRLKAELPALEAAASKSWRDTGALLEAAGAVLRRHEHLGAVGEVDPALRTLPRESVQAWLGALSERALAEALRHAEEDGLEAALADSPEESELHVAEVMGALYARDALQSQASALARWEILAGDDAGPLTERLSEQLLSLDASHRGQARLFVAANPRRRAERDTLDVAERAQAWWFTARAECDGLVAALAGRRDALGAHLDVCLECLEDLENASLVEAPLPQHLDEDALWALDMGTASPGERARWTAHAGHCSACGAALEALSLGDEAIDDALAEEAEAPPRQAARSSTRSTRAPGSARRPDREVLEQSGDFRLLLIRERGTVRLQVQPLRSAAVASALVFLPPGRSPIRPRNTPEGMDFALGDEAGLRHHVVAVRLELSGTGEVYQREFLLE
ncbi:MAG: hypothetical protein L0Y66_13215 [Myxococcaceae bacterium]|nr:hypothetical protein [Myxococcaceae bacterium]MCI0671124.1 hypothetical protein [Myxococcaceae bacterium]